MIRQRSVQDSYWLHNSNDASPCKRSTGQPHSILIRCRVVVVVQWRMAVREQLSLHRVLDRGNGKSQPYVLPFHPDVREATRQDMSLIWAPICRLPR